MVVLVGVGRKRRGVVDISVMRTADKGKELELQAGGKILDTAETQRTG